MNLVKRSPPALALVDWTIEKPSAVELCRRLRTMPRTAKVPIAILAPRGTEEERALALEAGADDFLPKPFSPHELIKRMNALLRQGLPHIAEDVLRFADVEMDTISSKVSRAGRNIQLSSTEFRLLRLFLEYPRWIFSRERLLDSVWGKNRPVEARTVDVAIRRLRAALNAEGCQNVIRTVRSAGYMVDD